MRAGAITALTVWLISVALLRSAYAAGQCTPFGDPPATVNQGVFAKTFSAHNPICFGGRVLGAWKDSAGSDRYACIYEPEQHSRDNPLPLVVFLHGSLATADSVKLTGLTGEIATADLGGRSMGSFCSRRKAVTRRTTTRASIRMRWDGTTGIAS